MFVVRPGPEILPFYLVWFLNEWETQSRLRRLQAGSSLAFLPKLDLENLHIPVPPLEAQARLVQLFLLGQEEEGLVELIRRKRKLLVEAVLRKAARSADQNGPDFSLSVQTSP